MRFIVNIFNRSSKGICNSSRHSSNSMSFISCTGTQNYSGLSVFSVVPIEGSIAPGQSQNITVTFQPDHPSVYYSDRLTIELMNKVSRGHTHTKTAPWIHVFTQPDLGLNHCFKSHHMVQANYCPPSVLLLSKCTYGTLYVPYSLWSSWYNNLNPVPYLSLRVKCVWWIWRVQLLHITCIYMEETCWQYPSSPSSLQW